MRRATTTRIARCEQAIRANGKETSVKHRAKKVPQHNYLRKIQFLWRTGALPKMAGYHQIDVAHDDWCGVFQGTRCNCDPDISLKWSQTATAQN